MGRWREGGRGLGMCGTWCMWCGVERWGDMCVCVCKLCYVWHKKDTR